MNSFKEIPDLIADPSLDFTEFIPRLKPLTILLGL